MLAAIIVLMILPHQYFLVGDFLFAATDKKQLSVPYLLVKFNVWIVFVVHSALNLQVHSISDTLE